jgi:AcrR family transcriptional regulator
MTDDLSPRERRYQKTRQAILTSALHIIREEGVDSLSMRGIAEAIDYSAGALYKYFDSKDNLIGELCTDGFTRLAANMRAALKPDMSMPQKLAAAGLEYVRFAQHNPEVFRMMFNTLDARPPSPSKDMESLMEDEAFSILLDIVTEGLEAGVFDASTFTAQTMAFQCWYVVHGMALLRLTMFTDADDGFDRMNEAIVRANVEALAQP